MKKQSVYRIYGTPFYLHGLENFEVEGSASCGIGFLPVEVVGDILRNALVVVDDNGNQAVGYLMEVVEDDIASSS